MPKLCIDQLNNIMNYLQCNTITFEKNGRIFANGIEIDLQKIIEFMRSNGYEV